MNELFVLIDSSTKKGKNWGESTIAWAAWWNKIDGMPFRAAAYYLKKEGPNKSFYDGVIRILDTLWYCCYKEDKLIIHGDCLLVINHINAKKHNGVMLMPFYRQVKKLERNYRCPVEYKYIERMDKNYKKIDKLVKNSRGLFRNLK